MANIKNAIALISNSEVTTQQVQRVQAIAHELDIANNDPMLPILIALETYHGAFSSMPQNAMQQATDLLTRILANFKATADAQAKASAMGVQELLVEEVGKAATSLASIQQERQLERDRTTMAQWAIGCVAGTVVIFGLFGWWMHSNGYESGKAEVVQGAAWMTTEVGNAAYKAVERDKAIAEWMGTSDAQRAFKMSKSGELKAVMDCSREGWEILKQADGQKLCAPKSGKKLQFGWMVP